MLEQIDMVDICKLFHPTTRQYTFFSATHGTFSKIDHILGHKASLNKFKKIKITPCIISDQNGVQLEPQKIFKHLETEQHTVEKQMGN
jgi:exonuclease III